MNRAFRAIGLAAFALIVVAACGTAQAEVDALGISGEYRIEVGGTRITISGIVINGTARVGTAFVAFAP
jgi:hypothetical protein